MPFHEKEGKSKDIFFLKVGIGPFPIIGVYLYHVILADQSNNWTTSGI